VNFEDPLEEKTPTYFLKYNWLLKDACFEVRFIAVIELDKQQIVESLTNVV